MANLKSRRRGRRPAIPYAVLRRVLGAAAVMSRALSAQTPGAQAPGADTGGAAEAITAAEIARHVDVLARDSMLGRDTPSRELERAAQYVAEQFKAAGLTPAGDSGGWIQRYPLPGRSPLNRLGSQLWFYSYMGRSGSKAILTDAGQPAERYAGIGFDFAALVATDTVLDANAPGALGGGQGVDVDAVMAWPRLIAVAGPHTPESIRRADVQNKVVVYVPEAGIDSARRRELVELLRTSNHVIIVADEDSASWVARRRAAEVHPPVVLDWYLTEARRIHRWAIDVWAPAIDGVLGAAGLGLADVRALRTPVVREIAGAVRVLFETMESPASPTAPNTLGVLPGREPGQVLMLTARLDNAGAQARRPEGFVNGTGDNAAGVAGLIAMAKAFKQAGVQPRRSIVFAAVSGGAKEFWGSANLVDKWKLVNFTNKIVLNINIDMIGAAAADSVRIAGLHEVELPVHPDWIAASRPELHLAVADGGSVVAPESDHFAFVRKAIPSLYLHAEGPGSESRYAGAAALSTADAERVARRFRFAFVLAREIANAPQTPRWTTEGRQRRSRIFGE